MTPTQSTELRNACALVENYLRTLGDDVCLIVTPDLIELADNSWSGSSTGETLYSTLKDALSSIDDSADA